jgi:hypothetical protein
MENKIDNEEELVTDNLDLEVEELDDRFTPGVHGGCVCSTTCDCTSCSCIVVF